MANYYLQDYPGPQVNNYNYNVQYNSGQYNYSSYNSAQYPQAGQYQYPGYQGQYGYDPNYYNQNQANFSQHGGYNMYGYNCLSNPQSAQQVGPMPPQQVGPMPPQHVGPMPPQQVGPMPPQQVGPMPPQQIGPMPPQQIGPMRPDSCLPTHGQKRKLMNKIKKEVYVSPKEAFPVSCGTHHKKEAEGYVPKRVSIPPEVMSRMALAKSKLEANPRDAQVQSQLNAAMLEYHMYQDDRQSAFLNDIDNARRKTGYDGPGLFTGQPLVEPMSREEIDSDDIRTFARPDMFMNLKPLRENFGKFIMKKFGWREGKPLGTSGCGSLAPIELTVKIDRKGLKDDMECMRRKPEGTNKNEGPNWICKIVNCKNPVCGISELHQAMGIPTPVFKLVSENNGVFKWNVCTNWGSFTPFKGTKSKKQAKSECAYHGIKEILRIESENKGVEPPSEAEESCFLRCIFIPSNKTVAGNKMLYKHFYSGGHLMNVLEPPGYSANQANDSSNSKIKQEDTEEWSYDVVKPSDITSSITGTVSGPHKLLTGANWMLKVVNGKNASAALVELCLAANKPSPDEYSQYIAGSHVVTVTTPWGTFTHSQGHKNRTQVRKMCCYNAIKEIVKNEATKFYSKAPVELAESDENCLSFAPDKS